MSLHIDQRMRKRYAAERRFKAFALTALALAGAFLLFFFADMISKGLPALQQAEILVDVHYSEASMKSYRKAVDRPFRKIVSRGYLRTLPLYMEDNPGVMGTTESRWVIATADVDQYLKGKAHR